MLTQSYLEPLLPIGVALACNAVRLLPRAVQAKDRVTRGLDPLGRYIPCLMPIVWLNAIASAHWIICPFFNTVGFPLNKLPIFSQIVFASATFLDSFAGLISS